MFVFATDTYLQQVEAQASMLQVALTKTVLCLVNKNLICIQSKKEFILLQAMG